uniref:Small integral membrane protein 14 n=1 Tax=Panagrolaimus sp. JU765 TaxID=591449 RepID=A0AC34Q942_9BILA
MSDDPCECFFNHEAMMRRLLSILRQSQEECIDENCVDDSSLGGLSNTMMMMALMGVFAVAMFLTRPNSLRPLPTSERSEKPDRNDIGGPPPPPTVG